MDSGNLYSLFSGQVLLLAIAMTRLSTAFLLLPLFSDKILPPLVRNSLFVTFSLVVLAIHPYTSIDRPGVDLLFRLFAAEAFIGIGLGFFFGLFLWAFESAGELIDTAIGSSMAMIFDPISGNEVTLFGEFLGRWVNYLFMASGGLLLIAGIVVESYALWPMGKPLPYLSPDTVVLFQTQFSQYFSLALMIAAPMLVLIFLVDTSMGLINRFAQQLNVLFLSISIKSMMSILMLIVLIPFLTSLFIDELQLHSRGALIYLEQLTRAGSGFNSSSPLPHK